MTTRLLLIRHGASHHKDDGVVGGPRGCRGLTPVGRLQAEQLAQRLSRELQEPPAMIYSNESWSELAGRTGRALEQIAARHRRQTVVAVAHAETIKSSMIVFGGLPLAPGFDMKVAPASITEWVMEGDPNAWPRARWTLVRFNDSTHVMAVVS
jgi:broad specificity phosphatase PhoE